MYGQQQLLRDVEAVSLLSDRFDEDLEVLANQCVLLGAETPLQVLLHPVQALLRARRKTRAEIGDPIVEPVETELGGPLRRKPRLFLEHDTRVLVAALHPVRRRSLGGGPARRRGPLRGNCAAADRDERDDSKTETASIRRHEIDLANVALTFSTWCSSYMDGKPPEVVISLTIPARSSRAPALLVANWRCFRAFAGSARPCSATGRHWSVLPVFQELNHEDLFCCCALVVLAWLAGASVRRGAPVLVHADADDLCRRTRPRASARSASSPARSAPGRR